MLVTDTMPSPNTLTIFLQPCTKQEIITIVGNCSTINGVGIDGFSIQTIKIIIPYGIAEQLANIFNESIASGVFPDSLKHAKITPVFKTVDKCMVNNNYRPISVLPVFSKVFEKLMHKRLVSFLVDKCNVIKTNQYGFRENHSTSMALLTMLDQITEEIYKKSIQLDCSWICLRLLTRLTTIYFCKSLQIMV